MADDRQSTHREDAAFVRQVSTRAARKLRAQREGNPAIWSGLSLFGMVGWSVAIPTLLGAWLGFWWDEHHPGAHSWTLALLVAGLILGCANAWRWVAREDAAMHDAPEEKP